ncbi:MtrAB system histidine kinase MtrB [Micrococcus sp.]|uniref:MtrAB system histidine kinase MtrB n=1 Tax=Micrococcus sp. TaxID=1271 RepID=UPI002A9140C9|nr:MtrAB system histidine kinase MtrB [Micrococcus sp.]MDY6055892.1 MtrAB system histidine kinase MtrB [Micrococcus sp.]
MAGPFSPDTPPRRDPAASLRAWSGELAHRWRSSLQLRTAVVAALLTLAAGLALSQLLAQQVAQALFEARYQQVEAEARRGFNQVRSSFAGSTATDAQATDALVTQTVRALEGDSGATIRRRFLLAPLPDAGTTSVGTLSSPGLDSSVIPDELRRAVAEGPGVVDQSVALPDGNGGTVPGIVFGTQVIVPPGAGYGLYLVYDLSDVQASLDSVLRVLLLFGGGFLVVNVLVAWWAARSVVRPVQHAALAAESLSGGNLAVRMPVRGEDELARLGTSFNRMADSIQGQITQLAQLSRMQQRFVSDVSHELRTPLTTVRMAADVLYGSREDFDPVNRRSAELLFHQVDRFQAMLADLLEITRFDAGAASLALEDTDLLELARDVVLTAQPISEQAGVPVYLVPQGGQASDPESGADFHAMVDPRRLERILRNLVNNAVEHAEGEPVDVVVAADADVVTVAVVDHGIGLSPEQVQRVFDRFWRADPSRKRTTGGSGLGLAIAAEDTRLHGGRLEAWGELGVGSVFMVSVWHRPGQPGPNGEAPPAVPRAALAMPPVYDTDGRRHATDLDRSLPAAPDPDARAAARALDRTREQELS